MSSRFILVILIILFLDFYVYQAVRVVTRNSSERTIRAVKIIYWSIPVITFALIVLGQFIEFKSWPSIIRVYTFAFLVTVYISKIFVVPFVLIDDLLRIFRWVGSYMPMTASADHSIGRLKFLNTLGLIIGALPFTTLIVGMIRGPYKYQVHRINLFFPTLPPAFDNLKIVQISDLHLGGFLSKEPLIEAVSIIKNLNPDLILFTGDLVNDRADEVLPFLDILKQITAPLGIFSILGNHDYGDYVNWPSAEDKKQNFQKLLALQSQLGWKMLINENSYIVKDDQRINILGVENWGGGRFPKYGDMEAAYNGTKEDDFKILLTHDPTHFAKVIMQDYKDIALTLCGHTHGFQFGIESKMLRWSPVQYVYDHWAGLYREDEQYVYVNRGLGYIGYPGRVGIAPEITLINLSRG